MWRHGETDVPPETMGWGGCWLGLPEGNYKLSRETDSDNSTLSGIPDGHQMTIPADIIASSWSHAFVISRMLGATHLSQALIDRRQMWPNPMMSASIHSRLTPWSIEYRSIWVNQCPIHRFRWCRRMTVTFNMQSPPVSGGSTALI